MKGRKKTVSFVRSRNSRYDGFVVFDEFKESDHPRDSDGKFSSSGGGGASSKESGYRFKSGELPDVPNGSIRLFHGTKGDDIKEKIKDAAIYDEGIFDMDDDDAESIRESLGADDLATANWEIQTLRGQDG